MRKPIFTYWLGLVFGVMLFSGCAMLKNPVDNIVGSYDGGLVRARNKAKVQVFNYDIDKCLESALFTLDEMDAQILKVDFYKCSIIALVSKTETDEADVGIFFTEEGKNQTRIEVSSLSTAYVDFVADKIFTDLQK